MLLFSKPKPKPKNKPKKMLILCTAKQKNAPKWWNSRGSKWWNSRGANGGIRVDWFAGGRVSKKPKPKKCWKHFPCAESDFPVSVGGLFLSVCGLSACKSCFRREMVESAHCVNLFQSLRLRFLRNRGKN